MKVSLWDRDLLCLLPCLEVSSLPWKQREATGFSKSRQAMIFTVQIGHSAKYLDMVQDWVPLKKS